MPTYAFARAITCGSSASATTGPPAWTREGMSRSRNSFAAAPSFCASRRSAIARSSSSRARSRKTASKGRTAMPRSRSSSRSARSTSDSSGRKPRVRGALRAFQAERRAASASRGARAASRLVSGASDGIGGHPNRAPGYCCRVEGEAPKLRVARAASERERELRREFVELFKRTPIPDEELLAQLGLYLNRQTLSRILFMHELYTQIVRVPGIVVELGVRWGQNLALFSSFRGMEEPFNHTRRVVGFDQLGSRNFPGETLALREALGLPSLRLRRSPYAAQASYAVLE